MAVIPRKTLGCIYFNSKKSAEQKLFSQDEIKCLIDHLLEAA